MSTAQFDRFKKWFNKGGWLIPVIAILAFSAWSLIARPAGVDVVNGLEPRGSLGVHERNKLTLDSLDILEKVGASQEEMEALFKRHWPNIETSVASWLSWQNVLPEGASIDSMTFHYGDAYKVVANDAYDKETAGYFSDQLVAFVYVAGQKEPLKILLNCLNEYFLLDRGANETLRRIGRGIPEMKFTIGRGQGLLHHVDWGTSLMLAEVFDLELYRGRAQINRNEIDVGRMQTLQDSTDVVQVTVRVYPGDEFDLTTMTLTRQGYVMHAKKHTWRTQQ